MLLFGRRTKDGQAFYTGMAAYGAFRFFMETLRCDAGGLHPFAVLTFAQAISLLITAVCLAGLLRLQMRKSRGTAAPEALN
jgi:prolipoprotein diacylglyceryltransferase